MKVVIATPLYPPDIGGPATYAKILEDELPKKDIEVVLIKFSDVRHLPKVLRHYAYYRRVLRAARDADMILALDPVSAGLPALKAAQKLKKKFVVKIVGDYAWEQGRQRFGITEPLDTFIENKEVPLEVRVFRWIQVYVAGNADKILVPSAYLKHIVYYGWGISKEKIEVIYNAISLEHIGTLPPQIETLKPYLVWVGRLVPWKRVDGIIEAVSDSRFNLVIVGDGPERKKLEAQAASVGTRILFTGELSHADTLAVIEKAHALVLNSTYEGLSHVLIESQLLGIPAIVTRAGGNSEVVGALNQLSFEVADSFGLKNTLSDFDRMDWSLLSSLAHKNSERFSIPTMIDATSVFLKSL